MDTVVKNEMNAVLYPHGGSGNHGCEAIVRSTSIILGGGLSLFSSNVAEDKKYGLDKVCECIKLPIRAIRKDINYINAQLRRKLLHDKDALDRLAYRELLEDACGADVFLSIGGDNYCYGVPGHIVTANRYLHKKGVPMVLWGCSIEPDSLKGELLEDLRRYDLIIARESITCDALREKGIGNVALCPDPAFVLPVSDNPILPEGFKEGNAVAVNFSPMVGTFAGEKAKLLLQNYVELIRWILKETDMTVLLLPHVVWSHNDDREALKLLEEKFPNEERVVMVEDQNAEQLKGVVSKCKFLVTARTHASIAGYSTCVPTFVLGYSVKARGIARDIFGSEEGYVKSVQKLTRRDEVLEAFKSIVDNEDKIKARLAALMPDFRRRAYAMKDRLLSVL